MENQQDELLSSHKTCDSSVKYKHYKKFKWKGLKECYLDEK